MPKKGQRMPKETLIQGRDYESGWITWMEFEPWDGTWGVLTIGLNEEEYQYVVDKSWWYETVKPIVLDEDFSVGRHYHILIKDKAAETAVQEISEVAEREDPPKVTPLGKKHT